METLPKYRKPQIIESSLLGSICRNLHIMKRDKDDRKKNWEILEGINIALQIDVVVASGLSTADPKMRQHLRHPEKLKTILRKFDMLRWRVLK